MVSRETRDSDAPALPLPWWIRTRKRPSAFFSISSFHCVINETGQTMSVVLDLHALRSEGWASIKATAVVIQRCERSVRSW